MAASLRKRPSFPALIDVMGANLPVDQERMVGARAMATTSSVVFPIDGVILTASMVSCETDGCTRERASAMSKGAGARASALAGVIDAAQMRSLE